MSRINYYKRVLTAYLTGKKSHLSFWHGTPLVNDHFKVDELGEYYMPFFEKADYRGQYDGKGIPMLDYHGKVGLQYNPIAIAQYGLGNFNLYKRTGDPLRYEAFMSTANWLIENLETNPKNVFVWNHHFDWEYRDTLKSPWYSALSQGQGISVLVRAYAETGDKRYLSEAEKAFIAFEKGLNEGGVQYIDDKGLVWFEETIVDPPTHILNGFIWSLWGVYDYYLATKNTKAKELFEEGLRTLGADIDRFDAGFWSLYEQSGTILSMVASPFYHDLHIVQLEVMYKLTGKDIFKQYAGKWKTYRQNPWNRFRALLHKIVFKILYY